MRRLALLSVAAATALGAQSGAGLDAAQDDLAVSMGVSQNLKGLLANQLDVEAIRSLDSEQLGQLCSSAGMSSSSGPAAGNASEARRFSLTAADESSEADGARKLLEQRCSRSDAPLVRARAVTAEELGIPGISSSDSKEQQKSKFCDYLENADSAANKAIIGQFAEAVGFANPFSSTANIFAQNCGKRRKHPHPNPTNPRDAYKVKPDVCQAAVPTNSDGTFTLPRGCGQGPRAGNSRDNPGRPGRGIQASRPHKPGSDGPEFERGNRQSRGGSKSRGHRLRRWVESLLGY